MDGRGASEKPDDLIDEVTSKVVEDAATVGGKMAAAGGGKGIGAGGDIRGHISADREDVAEDTVVGELSDEVEAVVVAEHVAELEVEVVLGDGGDEALKGRPVVSSWLVQPEVFASTGGVLGHGEGFPVTAFDGDSLDMWVIKDGLDLVEEGYAGVG